MQKQQAVAVLHIETDLLVLLLVSSAKRTVQPFIAVNDDSDCFLTAPDFPAWVNGGLIRVLRTKDLPSDQREELRRNFIAQQIAALETNFQPFEIATNKNLAGRVLFSLFGQNWGLGWKAKARESVTRFAEVRNPAFEYLSARNSSLQTAQLGVLYLASKHGLDQYSQSEREYLGTAALLEGAGAKVLDPEGGKQWLTR